MAFDAAAITLGDARVRSSLGEPLDVRIPVTLEAGESIEPGCFKLRAEAPGDVPRIAGGRVSVVRSSGTTSLRIQSPVAVNDPALVMGIVAACNGQGAEYRRDYALLVDPPAAARVAASAAGGVAASATPSLQAIAATLMARIGDTIESIARAIFPENRAVRTSYIEALRETNPQLAALGDNDPIPVDTQIALPDLRTFAHGHPPRHAQVAKAPAHGEAQPAAHPTPTAAPSAAAELPQPAPAREVPRRAHREPDPRPAPAVETKAPRAPERAAPRASRAPEAGFVLKLSSPEVDLSRSRSIDDRKRAQLRERQMILDQDDQVAALLALRHSVQQLETRVAELQLKLAAMPSSFPAPRAAISPIEPPVVTAAPPAEPKPAAQTPPQVKAPPPPPPIEAKPPAPAPVEAEPAAPAPVEAKPATPAPPAAAKPAGPEAPKTPAAKTDLAARYGVTTDEWIRYGLWVLAVLMLFAAGALAWRLLSRRAATPVLHEPVEERLLPPVEDDRIVVADEAPAQPPPPAPPQVEVAPDGRRIIDADVHLTTRLGDDSDNLRQRYIEERFPEITKGAIALDDPDSVVKGARLFYEDGVIARAVELLQLAIERRPAEIKAWLALFEIFRLERLSGEFAALARRFKEQHGSSPFWPKVQYFGREIDPGNALYQPPPIDKFETIGPAQAKRIAADATFDPIAENWLGAPMDFQNEVLANELRKAIMHEAGLNEPDLVPNPMPALRNIEMFTVA